MLKTLWRSRGLQTALGRFLALYLRIVRATSRVDLDAAGLAVAEANMPFILAMWHGQHFMVPFLMKPGYRFNVLISRHGDGEVNAVAASSFGIGLVRGSGAQRGDQIRLGARHVALLRPGIPAQGIALHPAGVHRHQLLGMLEQQPGLTDAGQEVGQAQARIVVACIETHGLGLVDQGHSRVAMVGGGFAGPLQRQVFGHVVEHGREFAHVRRAPATVPDIGLEGRLFGLVEQQQGILRRMLEGFRAQSSPTEHAA